MCHCPGRGVDTDQGGDLLAVEAPEFRHVGEQCAAHHRTDTRHTAQEVLFRAPDGAALKRVVEIAIDVRHASLEPADVIRHAPPDRRRRVLQPISRRGEQIQPLSSACEERVHLLDNGVRQRAWRGTHAVGNERHKVGIHVVGLGELSGGLRDVADLPRVRNHDRQARRRQRRHQRPLVSPVASTTMSRGSSDWRRATGAAMPSASFGAVHVDPSGRQATTHAAFEMSTPTKISLIAPPLGIVRPSLADAGSRPAQLLGLMTKRRRRPRYRAVC